MQIQVETAIQCFHSVDKSRLIFSAERGLSLARIFLKSVEGIDFPKGFCFLSLFSRENNISGKGDRQRQGNVAYGGGGECTCNLCFPIFPFTTQVLLQSHHRKSHPPFPFGSERNFYLSNTVVSSASSQAVTDTVFHVVSILTIWEL